MNDKKPLQQAVYNDVLQEYNAKAGETYQEMKQNIENEYIRRCEAYLPGAAKFEGDVTETQKRNLETFKAKYQNRGKLPKID